MDIDAETDRGLLSPPLSSSPTGTPYSSSPTIPGTPAKVWWFDDGNVVLIAEDTLFRVHRGMLAHHSVVFRDMFMIPLPEEFEQIEGCPVVHLTDGERDLGVLLGTLYEAHK